MQTFELIPELEAEVQWFSFGCVVDDKSFVNHFKSDSIKDIYFSKTLFVNYKKRLLIQLKTFTERVDSNDESLVEWIDQRFEFYVNYSQIKSIHIKDNEMVLKLTFPPLLYTIVNDYDLHSEEEEEYDRPYDELSDQKGMDSGYEESFEDWAPFDSCIDFRDASDVYELDTSYDFCGLRLRTTQLLDINGDNFTKINSIQLKFNENTSLADIISNLKVFAPLVTIEEDIFETIECKPIELRQVFDLPFAVEYSLLALTNHSFQLTDSLNHFNQTYEQFVDSVKELSQIDEKSVENSLNDLRVKIENNLEVRPLDDLQQSFEKYRNKSDEKWTNSAVLMIRRCILTPTRLLLLPALPLQESRFLRIANSEYVIRVLIKDEDFQLLSFTTGKTSLPEEHEITEKTKKFLFNTIVKRLSNGISIGSRKYELIGASTSQLRDHGLVLYACDDLNRTSLTIRQQIGNLENFRNAAKFIARIGQSMSQSMGFLSNVDCVEMIDDIEGGAHPKTGNPYCFSDGVGQISPIMAKELCATLHIKEATTFQIRYAGFKGILVLNPELEGRRILMRPSMEKFTSDSTDLDVLKVSEPRSCYLNRPLITILNQMGVTNDQFLELLFNRHKQLANAFDCECKAIQLMRDYSGLNFGFKQLLDSGIDILKEPFFVQIIQSIIKKVSLDLKNKARILIPFDSGRVMYGVLDESNTLKYGQVFVQYSHQKSGTKRVLEGELLVTKYPCMHAGDVRKLVAIDVPALHHIVDCIVFPSGGERPHPDEMAGSDLDGDEYSVIWYKSLIFPKNNYPPMYFPTEKAEDLGRAVTNEDILTFYCRFISNNQVGLIAYSHLVWADDKTFGVKSSLCEHLAFKYAVALDYAKTGINARLRSDQKPTLYPDFMMKSEVRPTYKSNKALGRLYQKNCYFHEAINRFTEDKSGFEMNPQFIDKRADIYMENARHVFKRYENSIKELMDRFGIESESSLISSTFNKTHKYLCTHNDNNDIHDLVTNIIKRLFNDLLKEFESGVSEEEELLAKASAWYQVSHEMNGRKSGFPWIVTKYLTKLAKREGSSKHECRHNSIILNSEKMFPKNSILNVFHKILRNSLKNINEESIDCKIKKVLEKYGSEEEIPINVLPLMLTQLTKDIEEYEYEYDLAITALMANMTIRRLGLINALKYENSIDLEEENHLLIVAISERVANTFKDDINVDNHQSLVSNVKSLTNVSQLAIKYGTEGHESYICVYGKKSSVEKFRQFITQRYIDTKLKNECFDSTFY